MDKLLSPLMVAQSSPGADAGTASSDRATENAGDVARQRSDVQRLQGQVPPLGADIPITREAIDRASVLFDDVNKRPKSEKEEGAFLTKSRGRELIPESECDNNHCGLYVWRSHPGDEPGLFSPGRGDVLAFVHRHVRDNEGSTELDRTRLTQARERPGYGDDEPLRRYGVPNVVITPSGRGAILGNFTYGGVHAFYYQYFDPKSHELQGHPEIWTPGVLERR